MMHHVSYCLYYPYQKRAVYVPSGEFGIFGIAGLSFALALVHHSMHQMVVKGTLSQFKVDDAMKWYVITNKFSATVLWEQGNRTKHFQMHPVDSTKCFVL